MGKTLFRPVISKIFVMFRSLQTSESLPPFGRRLRRERMLQVQGVIVRCEERTGPRQQTRYELACYFTDLAEGDRELIEQYVLWRTIRRIPTTNGEPEPARSRRSAAP